MIRLCLHLALLLFTVQSSVAQGSIPWTPVVDTGLVRTSILVPPQYSSVGLNPEQHYVFLPPGWTVTVFYAGSDLDKPRFLDWGPDSVLYVANMNDDNVLALPDLDRDGVADEAVVAAITSDYCGDVKFIGDTMITAAEDEIVKRWRTQNSGYVFDQQQVLINKRSQANQTGGNHKTRTVVMDTNRRIIFLSVGSRGNADREPDRAVIEAYDWDGSNRRIYARGVRNAVGMTLHPRRGDVWANNNGSDLQGDDVPPEWVDIVREEGFYGYPVGYHMNNWFNFSRPGYGDLLPITPQDSSDMAGMSPPGALVWAHCAPMELEWSHENMPTRWRNGLFMVMRGSWNRSSVSGAKIVYFSFDDDQDTIANEMHEFCTGFIRDSNSADTRWARPVGLALAQDGSVYMTSDDLHEFVLKLTPPEPVSVQERSQGSLQLHVYPNPARDAITISSPLPQGFLHVVDVEGRIILQGALAGATTKLDTTMLTPGQYLLQVRSGQRVGSTTFSVAR